jgi:hypothetical protein
MDEPVGNLASRVFPQQAVLMKECLLELFEGLPEILGRVVIVVEVNFDVAVPSATQTGELLDRFGSIHLGREKKRVLRGAAARILNAVDGSRVFPQPAIDPFALNVQRRVADHRFVVVRHAKEHVNGGLLGELSMRTKQPKNAAPM